MTIGVSQLRWRLRKGCLIAVGMAGMASYSTCCRAADGWGGSVGLTSDYLVRGISRSNDHGAVQLDWHYSGSSGVIAGMFTSTSQIDSSQSRDLEISPYLGVAWAGTDDWRGRILATYYAYPFNQAGAEYNYAELNLELFFGEWMKLGFEYSPDAPYYSPYRGLVAVSSGSAEANLQRTVWRKLAATAGLGYSYFAGCAAQGYEYWSIGSTYDLSPVLVAISYVGTSSGAKALFYKEASPSHWDLSVIWRF